ncbi:MAG: right-handed parallel beta-helix repeat-containing protein, partial [Planctomycetales bacterium]|nr:right-handed parallel beta-helix repeat-containing protein [Planctomycetales bacterium]
GAVLAHGTLEIGASQFLGNAARIGPGHGGALMTGNQATVISDTEFRGNWTDGDNASGGAIYAIGETQFFDTVIADNRTLGDMAPGGGVAAYNRAEFVNCQLTGNWTEGENSHGGSLLAGRDVLVENTLIADNRTLGFGAYGGGVLTAANASLVDSVVRENETFGIISAGGGWTSLYLPDTTPSLAIVRSAIVGNLTHGQGAVGGGAYASITTQIVDSTLYENVTEGSEASGGGGFFGGDVEILQSTISGNRTLGFLSHGGGVYGKGPMQFRFATVARNRTEGGASRAGGVGNDNDDVSFDHSVIADNLATGSGDDLAPGTGTLTMHYSLLPQTRLVVQGTNNQIGVEARLGPLADHGGPTPTHLPLPGSPLIDGGEIDPPTGLYDQRGFPFARRVGQRVDIGAVEFGGSSANFDENDAIDGFDFLTWQRAAGGTASWRAGDADLDGDADQDDLAVWENQFGARDAAFAALSVGNEGPSNATNASTASIAAAHAAIAAATVARESPEWATPTKTRGRRTA